MPRLPDFFIAGAPKAGTTSLYYYLDQHPQVYMSPVKEPNYFAAEIRPENFDNQLRRRAVRDERSLREFLSGPMREKRFGGIVSDWDQYLRLFSQAGEQLAVGEASVCYLWSPTAAERIAARIPGAKILVMLRHPADRAFSEYLHGVSMGAIRWSFREHIARNLSHRSKLFSVHYPFLEFGLYSEQLPRYLDRFGRNVWVEFHEDFETCPREVFRNICRFLGVDPEFSPDMGRKHLQAQVPRTAAVGWLKSSGVWQAAARLTPRSLRPLIRRSLVHTPGTARIDPADRRYLIDYYRQDIGRLARLLDRNLDAWLRQD